MTATEATRSFLDNFSKEVAVAIGALLALGYIVTSPREQISQLSTRIEQSITAQQARDQSQDDRIAAFKSESDSRLTQVGDDVRALVIARCLTSSNDPAIYAQLNCKARLGR